jgi:ferredoxin
MKVKIDRDLCVGIGNCVAVAPTVFLLDNEKKATVLDPA